MRYLGIDYGSKRVGVAMSDEMGVLAVPFKVILNSANLVKDVVDICKDKNIDVVVVGESLDFSQKENEIMREIKPFVEKLRNDSGLPVHMHPEFMTSEEAEQIQGKNEMHDASSAAIILRSFLERENNINK